MNVGRRQNWSWLAARFGILAAVALACPMVGYSARKIRVTAPSATLTDTNGAELGYSVASTPDGSIVVVGAPNMTAGGVSGAAFVFVEPSGGWGSATPHFTVLTPSTPATGSNFGDSVAISSDGSEIVVGAPGDNSGLGAAYVFNEPTSNNCTSTPTPSCYWSSVTTYSQEIELTESSGITGDLFGTSLGINSDGSVIVVGAPESNNSSPGTGAAYFFDKPSGGWAEPAPNTPITQTGELTVSASPSVSALADGDSFGASVAIDSDASAILVGAPNHTVGSNSKQGASYVFDKPAGGWATESQTAELDSSNGAANDLFGTSVAFNGTMTSGATAVVGAPGATSTQGAAYVFAAASWTTSTTPSWSPAGELTSSTATSGSDLGQSVAISSDGTTIIAGAPGAPADTTSTNPDSQGTLYQFNEPTRGKTALPWASENESNNLEFSTSPQAAATNFGHSAAVGISGRNTWVFGGAPNAVVTTTTGNITGAAFVFSK